MTFTDQVKNEFPQSSDEAVPNLAKRHRDRLLANSDWRALPDAPGDRAAWAAYRKALRDAPQNPDWPNIPIPEEPTE